jgi:hypothetical protein
VNQVYGADEQIGNAQEQNIAVIYESSRIPGKHKDTEGYDDAEYLGKAVEKQITVTAGQVQSK